MKKFIKTTALSLAAVIGVTLVLAGCGKKPQTPEQVVASYFAAVKDYDTASIEDLITQTDSSSSESSSSSAADSDAMYKALFSKVDGQIEGKSSVSGDTATVKVKISAPDMKKIMSDEMSKAFNQAFADAFSGSSTGSEDASDDMTKNIVSDLSKADVALTSTEIDLQLEKKNGKWIIKTTQELADAITGGMLSVSQSLSDSFSSLS